MPSIYTESLDPSFPRIKVKTAEPELLSLADTNQNPSDPPLSAITLGIYALPAIPLAALGLPIVVFLPVYYERVMGIDIAVVGLVFMLARFWDIFTDPIAGAVEDRTTLSFGRRRFWLLAAAPMTAFGAWLVFFPPHAAGAVYLMSAMFILYVGYTLLQVAHLSWGAELSRSALQRARVQGWREFAVVAGMLTVLATPSAITGLGLGDFADGVRSMGLFIIVGLPLAALIVVGFVKEPPRSTAKPLKWSAALPLLRQNKRLQITLIADILLGFAAGVLGSMFVYYFENYLGLSNASALLLLFFYFASGLAAVPLWMQLSYRLGKITTFRLAMVHSVIGAALIFVIPQENFGAAAAFLVIAGAAYGAGPFLIRSILSDVSEADAREAGDSKAGVFFGLLLMSSKLGLALATGITLGILGLIGFSSQTPTHSNETLFTLKLTYVVLPTIAHAVAAIVIKQLTDDPHAAPASE